MRAWKKWNNKRSEGRILIDVSLTRQFVKMTRRCIPDTAPHKGFKREYRNLNDRRWMMEKTWELIKQRNGVW